MTATSTMLPLLPALVRNTVSDHALTLVACEPIREHGTFSVYFANAETILHVSFQNFQFSRASWPALTDADLSALAFSFLVRSGKSLAVARQESRALVERAGRPFIFAMMH